MFLLAVLDGVELVDPGPEVVGVTPERDLELLEELVHPAQQGLRGVGHGVYRGLTFEHDHLKRRVSINEGFFYIILQVSQ